MTTTEKIVAPATSVVVRGTPKGHTAEDEEGRKDSAATDPSLAWELGDKGRPKDGGLRQQTRCIGYADRIEN
ncbi:hypothetical protein CYL77_08785 [Corynebacterium glutamicum]|uniref:Uncharacterized protein n=1 Tax=Corynebacterium glutamicum (strain ATCC 13032 / DSM 20300 / JCM 1318 / BCRC 11384 / CCUG 27702 / LMG 3730 / NBRC 12168 / NCIMB 10025 / NRRL B-2784 / 534) TaxID=196627 RepID=Q8NPS6_CORGL|nr:hypothetical protein [Corynebacterium glutamicum]CAF20117.1 hypothetical protein cg1954 [Corynebacterium glutamicum ATCC 13032]CCH24885.1 hypothetical protein WA5_1665 [Corynebacterium glutamicum K051]ARV64153.1 hypothetical protein B7P23_04195 [Corynebacterium glutamicum]AUI01222.1 hypothetical protein CYL77_08785 [Corynebacterium glutamicum]AUI04871.1 hypothetical protein C0I99_12480 [Corynebacterium glutamicum]